MEEKSLNKGIIREIIGPVIDIKFDQEHLPELLNAIHIKLVLRLV